MFFSIPGKQITTVELAKEITIAIFNQTDGFSKEDIVNKVYLLILPEEFREKGFMEIPGEEMFVVVPNLECLEKIVDSTIARLVESEDLIVVGKNPTRYLRKT